MSNTDFLGRAIDTVKKAIECDNDGDYEKAYQTYYSALELFMLALKWEKNPRSKEMIRGKTGEYMDRAEKLKNHLASTDNRKKPSALGANGKVAHGSGKGGGYVLLSKICCFILLTDGGAQERGRGRRRPRLQEASISACGGDSLGQAECAVGELLHESGER